MIKPFFKNIIYKIQTIFVDHFLHHTYFLNFRDSWIPCSSYFYYRETSICSCQLQLILLRRYFKSGYSVWHSFQKLVSMVKKEDVGIIYLLQPCVHTIICVCFLYHYCEHHIVLLQCHCVSPILCAFSGSKARTKSRLMSQKPIVFLSVCFASCPWKH